MDNYYKRPLNDLSYEVLGCAIEVHKQLGGGLKDYVYKKCLIYELEQKGLYYQEDVPVPLRYKTLEIESEFTLDILVEDVFAVVVKAYGKLLPTHDAQLHYYLRMLEKPKGVVFNFHCVNISKEGHKIIINPGLVQTFD